MEERQHGNNHAHQHPATRTGSACRDEAGQTQRLGVCVYFTLLPAVCRLRSLSTALRPVAEPAQVGRHLQDAAALPWCMCTNVNAWCLERLPANEWGGHSGKMRV